MAKFLSRKSNKSKQPEETNVPEVTPAWLTALLSKHGEEAAPYGSAPTRPSLSYADEDFSGDVDSDDDISDVLADIAVSTPQERIATSVDWGAPPAEVETPAPSSAMDNLLASFGADADAEETEPEPEPPETELYPADTPDWLDDVAAAPVAETPPPEPSSPPAVEEAETPDWLDDISSKPDETTAPPAASADPGTDWLSEIRGDALPAPEEQGQVPDWLVEFAAVGTASLAPSEKVSPSEAEQPIQPEMPPAEKPASFLDWLDEDEMEASDPEKILEASPVPPAEKAAPSFDWLDEMDIPKSAQPVEASPPEADETASDWLLDIVETAAGGQTAASTTEPSPSSPIDDDDLDTDWLAEVAAAYPLDPAITESVLTANDAPLPEPASDHPAEETGDALAAGSALGEIPDWLTAGDAEEALQTEEATPFGDLPDWMQDEAEGKPDWLADVALPQDEETEAALPDTLEPPADLPEWLLDATQETEAEIEALMVKEPPAETEKAEEEDGLDWKTGAALNAILASTDADEAEPESPVEVESAVPDWLADLQVDEESEEAALPDWIQVEAETESEALSEVEAPASAETADWLTELQDDVVDVESKESALPDWIQVEAEPEALSEVEAPAFAETADWLTELRGDAEETDPETPAEVEEAATKGEGGLDWKTGVAGAALGAALLSTDEEQPETLTESAKTEEIPDWLAEL
ncbi:MAG TPA: hypothetical protein G4N96_09095, partial [Chloroflexi bacterium]|nr:hypothetical protein [Chloroflexota bacterium]